MLRMKPVGGATVLFLRSSLRYLNRRSDEGKPKSSSNKGDKAGRGIFNICYIIYDTIHQNLAVVGLEPLSFLYFLYRKGRSINVDLAYEIIAVRRRRNKSHRCSDKGT